MSSRSPYEPEGPQREAADASTDQRPYAEPNALPALVDPSLEGYGAGDVAVRVREEDAMQSEYEMPANRKLGIAIIVSAIYPAYFACVLTLGQGLAASALPALLMATILFYGVRTLVNRRRLRLSSEGLTVRSGPLPSLGGRVNLAIAEVQEFRATPRRRTIDNAELWSLHAVLRDGRTMRVVRDLGNRAEVESITARFNETLGRLRGAVTGYR